MRYSLNQLKMKWRIFFVPLQLATKTDQSQEAIWWSSGANVSVGGKTMRCLSVVLRCFWQLWQGLGLNFFFRLVFYSGQRPSNTVFLLALGWIFYKTVASLASGSVGPELWSFLAPPSSSRASIFGNSRFYKLCRRERRLSGQQNRSMEPIELSQGSICHKSQEQFIAIQNLVQVIKSGQNSLYVEMDDQIQDTRDSLVGNGNGEEGGERQQVDGEGGRPDLQRLWALSAWKEGKNMWKRIVCM